jgi:hypothetical protein
MGRLGARMIFGIHNGKFVAWNRIRVDKKTGRKYDEEGCTTMF